VAEERKVDLSEDWFWGRIERAMQPYVDSLLPGAVVHAHPLNVDLTSDAEPATTHIELEVGKYKVNVDIATHLMREQFEERCAEIATTMVQVWKEHGHGTGS
jgi:hypothetical protein